MDSQKTSWLPAIFTYALLAALVAGQCQLAPSSNDIDLTLWTDLHTETVGGVHNCQPANWVFAPGVTNTVEQRTNTCGATHLVSDFSIGSTDIIRGTLTGFSLVSGSDDDYIGFNVGMDCGTAAAPASCSGDSVSIVWGAGFSNANPGLCFSRRNFPGIGVCPWGCTSGFPADPGCSSGLGTFLNNVNACTDPNNLVTDAGGNPQTLGPTLTSTPVYANPAAFHAALLGGSDRFCGDFNLPLGWTLDRDYDFIIQFTPTRLRVFVDFVEVIDYSTVVVGDPQMSGAGRITLMNNSQGNVRYANMQILDSGTDQCTSDPWTYVMPVQTCGAGSILRVDWGDGSSVTDYPVDSDQNVSISHVFSSTPAGFYQVTAILLDPSGTTQDTHSLLAFILDEPTAGLTAKTNGQCGFPKTCANDGEIFVSALDGGVSPFDLTFSHGPTFNDLPGCSGETGCNTILSGLPDGSYTLNVVDDNGCAAPPQTVQLFSSSVSIASVVETSCGNVDLTASSTCSPLSFAWSTTDGAGLNPTAEDQTGLAPGTYDVVVTDPNGCTNSASITVAYGLTNIVENDVFYMYIPREIRWANFITGTIGTVALVCPQSNTVIFNGDLSRTTVATFTPFGILPEDDCTLRIFGASDPLGCNHGFTVHVCANIHVGSSRC